MTGFALGIAGNIGAGKSTLTKILEENLRWKAYLGPTIENPYLEHPPCRPEGVGVPLADLLPHATLRGALAPRPRRALLHRRQDDLRGRGGLRGHPPRPGGPLGRRFRDVPLPFRILTGVLPRPPDLIIFLRASPEFLLERVRQRGRDYEKRITLDYLSRLGEGYEAWIERVSREIRVLSVPVEDGRLLEGQDGVAPDRRGASAKRALAGGRVVKGQDLTRPVVASPRWTTLAELDPQRGVPPARADRPSPSAPITAASRSRSRSRAISARSSAGVTSTAARTPPSRWTIPTSRAPWRARWRAAPRPRRGDRRRRHRLHDGGEQGARRARALCHDERTVRNAASTTTRTSSRWARAACSAGSRAASCGSSSRRPSRAGATSAACRRSWPSRSTIPSGERKRGRALTLTPGTRERPPHAGACAKGRTGQRPGAPAGHRAAPEDRPPLPPRRLAPAAHHLGAGAGAGRELGAQTEADLKTKLCVGRRLPEPRDYLRSSTSR